MSVLSFAATYLGRRVAAPGGLSGQCVDLANLYLVEVLRVPEVRANAVDWPQASIPGAAWVSNEALNAPSRGALVVWKPTPSLRIGEFGHIAICLTADVMHLLTLDQNWPDGTVVATVLHSYKGVAGWFSIEESTL